MRILVCGGREYGNPDLVIAFPGGKGTAMMVDLARKAGVEVKIYE